MGFVFSVKEPVTLRLRENGHHFADIFKFIFFESKSILIKIWGFIDLDTIWIQNVASLCWVPGGQFNIKMPSYQYMKSHCGDKTVVRFPILVRWHLDIESGPSSLHLHGWCSVTLVNRACYLAAISGTSILVSCHVHVVNFPQLIWRWGTIKFCPEKTPYLGSVIFIDT